MRQTKLCESCPPSLAPPPSAVVAPTSVVTPPIGGSSPSLCGGRSSSAWAADVLDGMVQMVAASGGGKGQSHTVG